MIRIIETVGKYLIGVIFIGGGVLFSYSTYIALFEGSNSNNWVSATTTITYTYGVIIDEHAVRTGMNGGSGVKYTLSPTYTFIATDGKKYTGHMYSQYGDKIDKITGSEEALKSKLVEERAIYYNPENPEQSAVIKPSFNPGAVVAFAFLSFFTIYGGIHIIIDEKKQLENRKTKNVSVFNFESGEDGEEIGSEKIGEYGINHREIGDGHH